jgi:hypothetical protein
MDVPVGRHTRMKKRCKIALGIAVPIVLLGLLGYYLLFLSRSFFVFEILWDHGIRQAQRRWVLLLCNTDHQALLKAGREILSQLPEDYLYTGGKRVAGILPMPKGIQIPKAIQDIRPRGVFVDYDGYLRIEMHGGMDHFGVRIYPEDYREPEWNISYVDRELLPGLWYYDDGYIHNPEYDKHIDALIEEHKDKKANRVRTAGNSRDVSEQALKLSEER